MQEHNLARLLRLVNTAYYRQDGNKAVCEVIGQVDPNCLMITLIVNGQDVRIGRGDVQDVVGKFNLSVEGWTTKPQLL